MIRKTATTIVVLALVLTVVPTVAAVPDAEVDHITFDIDDTPLQFDQTTHFTVTAHYTNGTTENVSTEATVTSGDSSVVSVQSPNHLHGESGGSVTLSAEYQGYVFTTNLTTKGPFTGVEDGDTQTVNLAGSQLSGNVTTIHTNVTPSSPSGSESFEYNNSIKWDATYKPGAFHDHQISTSAGFTIHIGQDGTLQVFSDSSAFIAEMSAVTWENESVYEMLLTRLPNGSAHLDLYENQSFVGDVTTTFGLFYGSGGWSVETVESGQSADWEIRDRPRVEFTGNSTSQIVNETVDGAEDNDVSEYQGQTGFLSTTDISAQVWDGSYSILGISDGNFHQAYASEATGLPNNVTPGDTIIGYFISHQNEFGPTGWGFGGEDGRRCGIGITFDDQANEIRLGSDDRDCSYGENNIENIDTLSTELDGQTWYRSEVTQWQAGGSITVEIYDADAGSQVGTLSGTVPDTHGEGGIRLMIANTNSELFNWDHFHVSNNVQLKTEDPEIDPPGMGTVGFDGTIADGESLQVPIPEGEAPSSGTWSASSSDSSQFDWRYISHSVNGTTPQTFSTTGSVTSNPANLTNVNLDAPDQLFDTEVADYTVEFSWENGSTKDRTGTATVTSGDTNLFVVHSSNTTIQAQNATGSADLSAQHGGLQDNETVHVAKARNLENLSGLADRNVAGLMLQNGSFLILLFAIFLGGLAGRTTDENLLCEAVALGIVVVAYLLGFVEVWVFALGLVSTGAFVWFDRGGT